MNEVSKTSNPETSEDSTSATSSRGLGCGVSRCGRRDGETRVHAGQGRARVNLSPRLAKEKGLLTSGTFGRAGSISLSKSGLQSFLENRLRQRLPLDGLTLFKMTWKELVTPAGRSLFQLAASGLRTSAKDFTSWPSPKSSNSQGPRNPVNILSKYASQGRTVAHRLDEAAALAGWSTPTCPVKTNGHQAGNNRFVTKTVRLLTGQIANGSGAPTVHTDPLNPDLSRWLQGLPKEWTVCADSAILSSLRKRKSS